MEQTCHRGQGSQQEAETTLARKIQDRDLCADKASGGLEGLAGGQALRTHSQDTQCWPLMTQSRM